MRSIRKSQLSEIVISVVNHILDTAYNLGYTEDDISLYMTRHDEPIFKIKKSALDLMTVLQDHSTVMVDGWTPLRLDWDFGYRYKVPDEELQSKFKDLVANFDETIVLWDLMRSQRGVKINGYNFTVEFITGTADVTWFSDKSIGDVVSDNQDDTNYVGEDQTYHCTLVRSDGKTGDVIGVKAQLVQ